MKTAKTTIFRASAALVSVILLVLSLASCAKEIPATDTLWSGATYTGDTTLGEGATSFSFTVEAGEKSVVFTIQTDETNLEKALTGVNLVEGTYDAYGLYVKKVNGILADYDIDQSYWSLYIGGSMAMSGISGVTVTDGAVYKMVYKK